MRIQMANKATLQFSSLGMLTPVEFETRHQPTTQAWKSSSQTAPPNPAHPTDSTKPRAPQSLHET
jgi:hypothetical protein